MSNIKNYRRRQKALKILQKLSSYHSRHPPPQIFPVEKPGLVLEQPGLARVQNAEVAEKKISKSCHVSATEQKAAALDIHQCFQCKEEG